VDPVGDAEEDGLAAGAGSGWHCEPVAAVVRPEASPAAEAVPG
jgi:hypothetical protein